MQDIGGLHELLFDRVVADPTLTERGKDLVIAAADGDEALREAVAGEGGPRAVREDEERRPTGPRAIYLRSVGVQGFRGVGPAARLDVQPGPGLTVITGRNGSGKSSFAEAAELALTGDNSRWSQRQNNKPLWLQGWRNLHITGPTEIAVELVAAGGSTTVQMAWEDGQQFGDESWTIQRPPARREPMTRDWVADLALYRPFLSYGELGGVVDKRPTELHAALHSLLGLGLLDEARDRLKAARAPLDARVKALNEGKAQLVAELATVADERARGAEALLGVPKPDLGALADLALGDDGDVEAIAGLRALAAITLPGKEVTEAGARIRTAADRVADASTADATSAAAVMTLLRAALNHHTAHGDEPCPVCGVGALDATWRSRTGAEIERLQHRQTDLQNATAQLDAAVEAARRLVTPVPAAVRRAPAGVDVDATRAAWQGWERARDVDPEKLADALDLALPNLTSAVTALQTAAQTELARLDETWRPVSAKMWAWYAAAERVAADAPLIADLRKAETWLKGVTAGLSNERMAPFEAQSQAIWRQLRQESNVDLGGVRLTGSGNQRKVLLDVTVDGTDSAALSVMSQGELHALGLALFLPRATRDESPFRFIMIDDPVQAMDPAKVDGLARVLSEIAKTRQVIVFSHDDRLADAVRRLPDPARIYEVQRKERSQVGLVVSSDPIMRYLSDARAVINDKAMPDGLQREIVANCCRGALEAAAHAKVRRVRLGRGEAHLDVDAALASAVKVQEKMTLAVFDDPTRGGDLLNCLNNKVGRWAGDTLQACKKGAHRAYGGDMKTLVDDTRRLAEWTLR